MYSLYVIKAGNPAPVEIVAVQRAADVLTSIPEVLRRHPDCLRVEVKAGTTALFAVDAKGALLEQPSQ